MATMLTELTEMVALNHRNNQDVAAQPESTCRIASD